MSNFTIRPYYDASEIPSKFHTKIIDIMNNDIMNTNWAVEHPHYSEKFHPFKKEYSILFLEKEEKIVGFTIYRIFDYLDKYVVYRFASEIRKDCQGLGGYRLLTQKMQEHIWTIFPKKSEVFYCWRTRNPVVWYTSIKLCSYVEPRLLPNMGEREGLSEYCISLANKLYPSATIEPDNMVMRNAYGHLHYHNQPHILEEQHPINKIFKSIIPNYRDAFFSLGILNTYE